MNCPRCNNPYEEGTNVCKTCGYVLNGNNSNEVSDATVLISDNFNINNNQNNSDDKTSILSDNNQIDINNDYINGLHNNTDNVSQKKSKLPIILGIIGGLILILLILVIILL